MTWLLALALVAPLSVAIHATLAQAAGPLVMTNEVISQQGRVLTSSAFSTTNTNELLVAFLSDDANGTGATSTLTGAGLTWTLAKNQNAQKGNAQIWWAIAASALTNVTVTETRSSAAGTSGQMTIEGFTGEDLTTPIGASPAGASGTVAAESLTITTTKNNSWVWGVGNDWSSATARTVGGSQTMVDQRLETDAGNTFWTQQLTAATATSGTVVTFNDTGPASDLWNLAAVEIRPSGASAVTPDIHVAVYSDAVHNVITTKPMTTVQANEALIAFITTSTNAIGGNVPVSAVTSTGGLSWTKAAGDSSNGPAAEVWWALAPAIVTNVVMTVNEGGGTGTPIAGGFVVLTAWSGADSTNPIGATITGHNTTGVPTVNLTTTRANAWVWGVGADYTAGTAHTVGASQTKHYEHQETVTGNDWWVQNLTSTTPTSGTVVTTNDTAPNNENWSLAAVEILPDPTTLASVSVTAASQGAGGLAWQSIPATLSFPATALSATQQTASQGMALDISDLSGSGNGWNIQVSGGQLTSGAHTLAQVVVTAAPTQVCDTAGQCTAATTNVTFPWTMTTSPQKLFNATAGTGMGNGTVTPTFIATIPAYAFSGAYTATWTFSLSSGP